jgi:hypothetical protein
LKEIEDRHAIEIRNSANKLRTKVQANNIKGYQKRFIDLNDHEKMNKSKSQARLNVSSADRKNIGLENRFTRAESEDDFKSALSPNTIFSIQNQNYDSKLTFSPEKEQEKEINALKEKLAQAEGIINDLQSSIQKNNESYKQKYAKMVKEIQELESDNIGLHQLVKSKISEIQEIKNENLEYKHVIASNNMINQKLNLTEEELRIKIEELMNKITEQNFSCRQKDEEIQSLNRKISNIQMDMNNAKNIEKSLNLEIEEIRK